MTDNENIFSEAPNENRKVVAIFPPTAPNGIVLHLSVARGDEILARAPVVFLDQDGDVSPYSIAAYSEIYGTLTGPEVLAIQDIVWDDVAERFHRQLIIANECGPTDASTMQLYLLMCAAEGVDPMRQLIAL